MAEGHIPGRPLEETRSGGNVNVGDVGKRYTEPLAEDNGPQHVVEELPRAGRFVGPVETACVRRAPVAPP
jgi:hypothetical protein